MADVHHQSALHACSLGLDIRFRLDEVLFEEGLEDVVEAGDHLSREVHELQVKFPIELFNVPAVDFEAAPLGGLEVVELSPVDLLRHYLAVDMPADLELKYESFHGGHGVADVDGSAVDVLALLRLHVCSWLGVGGFGVDGSERGAEGCFAEDGGGFVHNSG